MTRTKYSERVEEENYQKVFSLFHENPTQIYSQVDVIRGVKLHKTTVKKHLKTLLANNLVKEVFTKPKLHLFQYNGGGG